MNKALAMIAVILCLYLAQTKFICVRLIDVLPFVSKSGHSSFYSLCSLLVIGITLWGIFRVCEHQGDGD